MMETSTMSIVRRCLRPGSAWLTALLLLMAMICASMGVAHAAETITYYYTSPQGTVLAKADASGNILSNADYRPYGTQALGTPEQGPGYTGHVNDIDTSFVYMQARYYDPTVGRFLSGDPKMPEPGEVASFARYSYADSNPVSNIDPDGRQTLPPSVYTLNWQDPTTRAVAREYALNAVPGYGLYSCVSAGCNGAGWTISVASTAVSALGVVGRVSAIARETAQVSQLQRLQAAVKTVHEAMDPIAQTRRATAGAILQDGRMVFSSGASQNLSRLQREAVASLGGVEAKGATGLHAEQKIFIFAEGEGTGVKAMSTEGNRAICGMCQGEITGRSGSLIDRHNAEW